jgi:hypothetical protein
LVTKGSPQLEGYPLPSSRLGDDDSRCVPAFSSATQSDHQTLIVSRGLEYMSSHCFHALSHCIHTSSHCMHTSSHCIHTSSHCMHATSHCVHTSSHCIHTSSHCIHMSSGVIAACAHPDTAGGGYRRRGGIRRRLGC